MKIINLNSKYDLSSAQVNYAHSIVWGDDGHHSYDSISRLMDEIPIFLLKPDCMPIEDRSWTSENPPTERLGFYQHHSLILGVDTPVIGLCPERIVECAANEEELMVLTTKVIVHEFAHAKMRLDPSAHYSPKDQFYDWMEEAMANLIALEYFSGSGRRFGPRDRQTAHVTTLLNPFDYVRDFIAGQPDNYRFGLDLYDHRIGYWWIWRKRKNDI